MILKSVLGERQGFHKESSLGERKSKLRVWEPSATMGRKEERTEKTGGQEEREGRVALIGEEREPKN